MQISDPCTILQGDLPLFVFSDSATDLVSFLITWKTKGNWNHAMTMTTIGKFDSQSWTYSQIPVTYYMKKGNRLNFYSLVNINPQTIEAASLYVQNRLALPWYKKAYDWIGILGQAIGFPKIHTPGLEYCSVDVTHCLKKIAKYLPMPDQMAIENIPDEINPQALHDYMVANPQTFKPYGLYESDEGVIV